MSPKQKCQQNANTTKTNMSEEHKCQLNANCTKMVMSQICLCQQKHMSPKRNCHQNAKDTGNQMSPEKHIKIIPYQSDSTDLLTFWQSKSASYHNLKFGNLVTKCDIWINFNKINRVETWPAALHIIKKRAVFSYTVPAEQLLHFHRVTYSLVHFLSPSIKISSGNQGGPCYGKGLIFQNTLLVVT